ncbi:serine hydrolase domain-containing protein [Roseateles paludis]|uniref:Serine hydrolase domain-containing protein n=1 Tax=Roseateles paludis TaxID=3145238 RepID=A0ABV0FZQ5_9BURK
MEPLPPTLPGVLSASLGDDFDGLIAYVDVSDRPPALHAAGFKDRRTQVPSDPQALFKIASISKLYVAAAAAQLAAEGALDLGRPLATYLPQAAQGLANADRITATQLLTHRSGLYNFTDASNYHWFDPPQDLEGHLSCVRGRPALFEPGAAYRYSNTNYLLVGAILDSVLSEPHQAYIERTLLRPQGLHATHGPLGPVDPDRLVSAYHPAHAGDLKAVRYTAPGGSLVATAQDVGIFTRALREGRILSTRAQRIYASHYVFDHTGLLPGYHSIVRHHAALDAVIVLLANSSNAPGWGAIEAAETRVLRWARR